MKKNAILFIALVLIISLSGCANTVSVNECVSSAPDGFWWGLWHGFTAGFSFIGSLLDNDIAVYSINNTGGWYDFGFVLGAGILFGGAGSSSK